MILKNCRVCNKAIKPGKEHRVLFQENAFGGCCYTLCKSCVKNLKKLAKKVPGHD